MQKILPVLFMFLLSGCSAILFHPDRHLYDTPAEYGLGYRDVTFASRDGTPLHGWWIEGVKGKRGAMVVAHGNAENLSSHFRGWVWLAKAGYDVFIFDYRGYGKSGGEPSFDGVLDDTAAALKYAAAHYDGALYACGQSIGGVLLLNALSQEPYPRYRAAVIDSSYSALERAAAQTLSKSLLTWPFQWVPYLTVNGEYDPLEKLETIEKPLLFIAGSRDAIISPNNSWQLFDAARRPREFWLVTGAGHIDALNRPDVQKALLEFLDEPVFPPEYSTMKIYDNLDKITEN